MKKNLFTLIAAATSLSTFAGNLSVPLTFDSAKVLPKKIRNVRYNQLMTEANNKFGSAGSIVQMGNALNVNVSYAKMISGKDTVDEQTTLQAHLIKEGIDENSTAGQTTGVVNVEVNAQVPIFAYGLTKKWTAAIVVPTIIAKTNVDFGFNASASLQKVAADLIAQGKGFKATEVQSKTNNAVVDKILKKGYEMPVSEEKTMLGDIRLVNKYLVRKDDMLSIALVGEVVLPTGEEKNINKAIDVAAGDGQLDLGFGAVYELNISPKLVAYGRTHYTFQLADQVAYRVPEESDSQLSKDIDPQVERDLGNIFYQSLGVSYQMTNLFKLKSQYTYQFKQKDEYNGSKYSAERYSWITPDSEQTIHSIHAGVSFSTISLFRAKKFPVPLEFNFTMGKAFSGFNVVTATTYVAEFAMYF
jgi:hypothetical protein